MYIDGRKNRFARKGFSLLVVLVIALVGMALIGVAFYIYESSTGQAATTLERAMEYNALQGGLEKGKDYLVDLMNNTHPAPRWFDKASLTERSTITDPDTLLIPKGTLSENLTVHGKSATLDVFIYDLRYHEEAVDTGMAPARLALMPPAVEFEVMQGVAPLEPGEIDRFPDIVNGGVYLLRAVLTINHEQQRVETVFIQRNRQQ